MTAVRPPLKRLRLLVAITPTMSPRHGMGKVVADFAGRFGDRVELHLATASGPIDPCWGEIESARLHPSGLAARLRSNEHDVVESVGWMNAEAHESLLDGIGDGVLIYTPHDQPTWTETLEEPEILRVEASHRRMIDRADVVACDSPAERDVFLKRTGDRDRVRDVGLGCDFLDAVPGPIERPETLLVIGDASHPRKRFDWALSAMRELRRSRPGLRLVVIGPGTERLGPVVPPDLEEVVDLRGYVPASEYHRALGESRGLMHLSTYEAFGMPILEALAAGTPVFLARQDSGESLFGAFRGAHFFAVDDFWDAVRVIDITLNRSDSSIGDAIDDRPRLRARFELDRVAERKWRAITTAWTLRYARRSRLGSRSSSRPQTLAGTTNGSR